MDGYCERLDGSFWAEPANALTNLAFLVAAVLAAVQLRRSLGRAPVDLAVLTALLAVISVGSFLFHTLATGWAALADTVPIGLFMLAYVVVFAHRFAGVRPGPAWLAAPVFVVFAAAVGSGVAATRLPAPGPYLAALLGLVGLTGWLATRPDPEPRRYVGEFGAATGLFAVSLTLRQLDGPLCPTWPLGTHFGWHLCNAAVLYLLVRAAIRRTAALAAGQPLPVTDAR
ncbi:MAG TPA: ceramidase domain-containing protein [Pseudonocardia sp.]|nr:ceramidase domain-containing protein [Pseudonocardia sp.]